MKNRRKVKGSKKMKGRSIYKQNLKISDPEQKNTENNESEQESNNKLTFFAAFTSNGEKGKITETFKH